MQIIDERKLIETKSLALKKVQNIPHNFKKWFIPALTTLEQVFERYQNCCSTFNAAYEKYDKKSKDSGKTERNHFLRKVREWRNLITSKFSDIDKYILDMKSQFGKLTKTNESVLSEIYEDLKQKKFDNLEEYMEKWKQIIIDFSKLYISIDLMAGIAECRGVDKKYINTF